MNPEYRTISDTKFNFVSSTELRNSIIKAGRKNIIFVEGYDDKVIFEILYEDYSDKLRFVDVSAGNTTTGGCEEVQKLLKEFVDSLQDDKRFYGVIDRDLKLDEQVESKKSQSCYDSRLFIFFERYTLEN